MKLPLILLLFASSFSIIFGSGFVAYKIYPTQINSAVSRLQNIEFIKLDIQKPINAVNEFGASVKNDIYESYNKTSTNISNIVSDFEIGIDKNILSAGVFVDKKINMAQSIIEAKWDDLLLDDIVIEDTLTKIVNNNLYMSDAVFDEEIADIEPSSGGDDLPPLISYEYGIEEDETSSEAVLVPVKKTIISSSRDGKIKQIFFKNGELFKKDDVLLEYYCDGLKAELEAFNSEVKFASQKQLTTSRLFDLELVSNLEKIKSQVENKQTMAKHKNTKSRLGDCVIRANYDGRVVKRLANANEYTRTDRVLMEVASVGVLDVEFLLPSIWLRWVNVDAPITLTINETGQNYTGYIQRIYGEVDPVSQSIQIRAKLDNYNSPLLPGMSGKVVVNARSIRDAGVIGFLETKAH